MNATLNRGLLSLHADIAADLMIENLISIRDDASVYDAVVLFTDKAITAAPVIDAAGRPLGVLSSYDVIVHDRNCLEPAAAKGINDKNGVRVTDLMTPVVFSVAPNTPAPKVVELMLTLNVHRLFVVDDAGVLVGVISPLDILRHLHD